ncbi:hypothetical protein [Candidatus Protochlamydia phocaeensis]|uniref:hypothetical protein n=1 Tax=Candidatus Protochlamydia phocaeensis TaxID=1414722 RepID=UPI000838DCE7|nr:hypothetical protein [Candidatus Protochlamydia phocaeensis]
MQQIGHFRIHLRDLSLEETEDASPSSVSFDVSQQVINSNPFPTLYDQFNRMDQIKSHLQGTVLHLKRTHSFPRSVRRQFNQFLNQIFYLVQQDKRLPIESSSNGFLESQRIDKLDALHRQVKKIQNLIQSTTSKFFINSKVTGKKGVLFCLAKRVQELKTELKQTFRLPFQDKDALQLFYEEQKKKLLLEQAEGVQTAQKELFHWLGGRFDEKKLEDVKIESYEGSWEFHSIFSYLKMLERLVQVSSNQNKEKMFFLLCRTSLALEIALKTTFVFKMQQDHTVESEQTYFEGLAKVASSQNVSLVDAMNEWADFNRTYTLAKKCQVPFSIIINNIAWDIITMIHQIEPNDLRVFNVGIREHSITVQVERLEPSEQYSNGEYRYAIFNTGSGRKKFHYYAQTADGNYCKPYIIKGLKLEAFSYSFIESLVKFMFDEESTIQEFYELHRKCLVEGGGSVDLDSGSAYLEQKFGTCAYSSFEAWIDSHLTLEEVLQKELIKSSLSVQKQARVVQILEQDDKKAIQAFSSKIPKKRRNYTESDFNKRKRKLKESKIFLDLGEKYFSHLQTEVKKRKISITKEESLFQKEGAFPLINDTQ